MQYIRRMNRGIKDAVAKGMALEYVERVMRRWVTEESVDEAVVEDPFLNGPGDEELRRLEGWQ